MNRSQKHIAVVSWGVKLGTETKGYTRFLSVAQTLRRAGYQVDLITSVFQHWDKSKRDVGQFPFDMHEFGIVFINEPGYVRNIDPLRMLSHARAAKNLARYLDDHGSKYDLIYCEIPPNDVALAAARYAQKQGIPFIADVNDLWPEAMKMAFDVPVLNNVLYAGLQHDKRQTMQRLAAVVGTSDEYAQHAFSWCDPGIEAITVYVGNDLAAFDRNAAGFAGKIAKPADELWVTYAGTLGASYDIKTLIDAVASLADGAQGADAADGARKHVTALVFGDGPDGAALRAYAAEVGCPAQFMGYMPYEHMCAYLAQSDITVNSLIKKAPQSVVTKIGDYLAAGKPMINTGSSIEFRQKVEADGFGINVPAEDAPALARAIEALAFDPALRQRMGQAARTVAEQQFDRARSYRQITALIDRTLARWH